MAFSGRRTPHSALTQANLLALLAAAGTAALALFTAYFVGEGVALLGAMVASAGCIAACAGAFLRREDIVLYGSLPALAGSALCGVHGLEALDPFVALGMTGAVLCSLALYEFGTTAALVADYIASERPREPHDLGLVEEAVREQSRFVLLHLGAAFLITMAVLVVAFLVPMGPASPAAAAVFGAMALTGAAVILVLRGGDVAPAVEGSNNASQAGERSSVPPHLPGPPPWLPLSGLGPGRRTG